MDAIVEKKVYIAIQRKKVFLVNQLEEPIEELIYQTYSVATYDDVIAVSNTPHYRVRNIPSGHSVLLEILDGWEDGSIYYELVALKSNTYLLNTHLKLKQKKLSGLIKLPPQIDCIVEKLGVDDGFIVDLSNKKLVNELYWKVEELKAYTDLTESRFDIENAQRRLWQMAPILKKSHFPQEEKLYNELCELLENPMFFEKALFSKKVDETFKMIEAKHK